MKVTLHSVHTKSPVLFILFNRPGTTKQVFEKIKEAKPARLYVAADGPRPSRPGEAELCASTRAIIEGVDWECEVKTLFRSENLGCKDAVSSAINWFFDNEHEGIILEDDCLPAPSFFSFCDAMLEKYRNDTRVRHITGCNLQSGKKWGDASYYFSNITHVWGWASWRRVWADYDKTLNRYNHDIAEKLTGIFHDPFIVSSLKHVFDEVKAGKIDTWDYQLDFANFFNNGLTIIPNENLISNIGFGNDATHTLDHNNIYANIPLGEITQITHPQYLLPEKRADVVVLKQNFNIDEKKRKHKKLGRRIKRWLKPVDKI
ncbi:nucleotide-diphospho-sugar transferase [Mucilaginibacter sp. BJC16-A38]|uniref:nucleotide-diphospho-sugar transferase n=1 Tax=Mucilaginibacter phenanthrenivorans TaxID=1234842 RepID=UPI002157625C|nr:nucleotide-diphospho-sugar transferase [Mucilaginibacter phenanthrenivorans]MCR8558586.1 nucleotide-diphospho-sugar transferase [Mucilaginibacter phenanthrenivorans]